jgi:hypothetical protein
MGLHYESGLILGAGVQHGVGLGIPSSDPPGRPDLIAFLRTSLAHLGLFGEVGDLAGVCVVCSMYGKKCC